MVRTVIIASLVLTTPAAAQTAKDELIFTSATTGSVLMNLCGQNWVAGKYDPCGAYITGLIDGLGIAGNQLCPPTGPGITNQMQTMVYRAVRDQPELWHYPANWIAKDALQKHFSCRTK